MEISLNRYTYTGNNIASTGNNIVSGKSLPENSQTQVKDTSKQIVSGEPQLPRSIDMRNVSVNEINHLIRNGVDGLLDAMPFIPPNVINQYGSDAAANMKVDFMGQIESAIAFNKSINKPVDTLEEILGNLKKIDGMALNPRLDTYA